MLGRHKPNVGMCYPVMLRPDGPGVPAGSTHPDIDINQIVTPSMQFYYNNLHCVLASPLLKLSC